MEATRASLGVVAVVALLFAIFSPAAHAQISSPAPSPTSDGHVVSWILSENEMLQQVLVDGTSIDQGIAYVLMLVALVLTYLIHASDLAYRL
ncbi:hypothetical protein JRO89_XS13G0147700 [Xanthoceras sorbifolium]|uniref:Uncharacterized protein n=1 Tax=Xanthoceras sorbifolium TaxID=99658 RepID=A0ABQ8H8E1_9ROSI|nr:hypothetical protein JRO89_XS13G0147700 [Xanthoceras sorbifolium]